MQHVHADMKFITVIIWRVLEKGAINVSSAIIPTIPPASQMKTLFSSAADFSLAAMESGGSN